MNEACITRILSPKGTSQLSCTEAQETALQHCVWGHFKQQNPQEAQNCEKHSTTQTAERTPVYCVRAETRRLSSALLGLSWERVHPVLPTSHPSPLHVQMPTSDQESAVSIDLGLQIHTNKWVTANTESVNREDQLKASCSKLHESLPFIFH